MGKNLLKDYKDWDKQNADENAFWFSIPEAKKKKMYKKLSKKDLEDRVPPELMKLFFKD